jgi:Sulfotransferase domain
MALAVIGAGFGRTGTLSLRHALERLGLGPCYHMYEVVQNPGHVDFWQRAADGEAVDRDELLGSHRSAVDWPVCSFWAELAAHYPQAKVILTVRDPGRWFESAWNTIFPRITGAVAEDDEIGRRRMRMQRQLIVERTFGGDIGNPEHAQAVFLRHIEAVKQGLPPERLLVYEIAEGWAPLCRFLGRPVPDAPFPHVNATAEFRQRFHD